MMASLDRLAATPATATYGADVTKELLVWLTAALVVFALLAVVGVVGMFTRRIGASTVIRGGDRRRAALTPPAIAHRPEVRDAQGESPGVSGIALACGHRLPVA